MEAAGPSRVHTPKANRNSSCHQQGGGSNNGRRLGGAGPGKSQLKKRPTSKPYRRENDIYITCKSHFKSQLKQCENILNSGIKDIYLHCLGNSINRGINLALNLVDNSNGALVYEANTSTIELIDEVHPLNDDEDLTIQKRMNSALHIKVSRSSDLALE